MEFQAFPYLAFSMGLLSSFHCIGMCGPIALAVPNANGNALKKTAGLILYNLGRATSYAALGAVIGVFGSSAALFGYLKYLTIVTGIFMLFYVLWPKKGIGFSAPTVWIRAVNALKRHMSSLLQNRRLYTKILLGMLNGLIPCGLVYLALASSAASGSMAGSALFMFTFGLGTLPGMMLVGFLKTRLTPMLRAHLHKTVPVFVAAAGIWLIVRGVTFEYEKDDATGKAITICHGK